MTDEWKKEFSQKFTDNILEGGYGNDLIIGKEDVKPLMDFISELLENQKEEERKRIVKKITEYYISGHSIVNGVLDAVIKAVEGV
jgi:RNA binding exosome subunit